MGRGAKFSGGVEAGNIFLFQRLSLKQLSHHIEKFRLHGEHRSVFVPACNGGVGHNPATPFTVR